MDDPDHKEIVIVRRRGSGGHDDHHGGVWKIAYADFMTAMMAFFLVLWLVNSSSKEAKESISRYFNPIKLVDTTVSRKGLQPNQEVEAGKGRSSQAVTKSKDHKDKPETGAAAVKADESEEKIPPKIGDPLGENGLFANPEKALDRIAAKTDRPRKPPAAAHGQGTAAAGRAYRDPFKPLDASSSQDPVLDLASAFKLRRRFPEKASKDEKSQAPAGKAGPTGPAASTESGDTKGEALHPSKGAPAVARDLQGAIGKDTAAKAARQEKAAIVHALGHAYDPASGPDLDVKVIPQGILISLTDKADYPMFDNGSAQPQPSVVRLMQKLGAFLKSRPGAIIIRGHTDARPFHSASYDNWRLSADRAQIARYMLLRGGVDPARIEHVEGWADHDLKDPAHPFSAENRRIDILLRKASP